MRNVDVFVAELHKTATLPATWAALAVAVLGPVGIALLNAFSVRAALAAGQPGTLADWSPVDIAFSAVPVGTVGAVILGAVAMGSEYSANRGDAGGGRQITTTLAATSRRRTVLGMKALVVVLLLVLASAVAIPGSLVAAHVAIGDVVTRSTETGMLARSFGAGLYWILMSLVSLAITALTRSVVVPLVVLVVNSAVVSLSLLLTRVTSFARYLPDLAGARLYASEGSVAVDGALDPVVGGLVMATWAAGSLAVATILFQVRDA